ncbi:hypothetical protein [Nannocystis pusilla]|uniref:hypothetical protein n=1 Tax=Nannocystis pusilla TaxID=889268 RepID=UPI003B7EEEFB
MALRGRPAARRLAGRRPVHHRFLRPLDLRPLLSRGQLILGFESGQPWSEYGSYGDRYGGLQVFAPTADPSRWHTVAIEYDYRSHDEDFVPVDAIWHPRGVLAWLRDGCLCGQVIASPRPRPTT